MWCLAPSEGAFQVSPVFTFSGFFNCLTIWQQSYEACKFAAGPGQHRESVKKRVKGERANTLSDGLNPLMSNRVA